MRFLRHFSMMVLAISVLSGKAFPQQSSPPSSQTTPASQAIRSMLDKQIADYNAGDLDAFENGYKNSPDLLFMGPTVRRGYTQMVARDHAAFPTRENLGILSFLNVEVQPLDERFAIANGRYHLERKAAGGGNADGFFFMVLEHTPQGWKITVDDPTPDSPQPKK